MSRDAIRDAKRPDPDKVLVDIADYVLDYDVTRSQEAMQTARQIGRASCRERV